MAPVGQLRGSNGSAHLSVATGTSRDPSTALCVAAARAHPTFVVSTCGGGEGMGTHAGGLQEVRRQGVLVSSPLVGVEPTTNTREPRRGHVGNATAIYPPLAEGAAIGEVSPAASMVRAACSPPSVTHCRNG